MTSAVFTVGDTGPSLEGDVNASLVGASVQLHIRKPSGEVLSPAATITGDGSAGTWTYEWTAGDLDEAGTWAVEAQVTFGGGAVQTFGPNTFRVQPQIA